MLTLQAFVHRDKLFVWQLYAAKPKGASTFPASGIPWIKALRNTIVSAMPSDWNWGIYAN